MIPIFSNTLGDEELHEMRRVIESRWLGIGKECEQFEKELAQHFAVPRLLLTNCATSGIYLALRCLDLQPGDEVIIPAIHYVATAGAVIEMGGTPVFADVHPHTLNVTPGDLLKRRSGRTVGVILNHYGGHPCDMDEVMAATRGLWVLEDAANAPASTYDGQAVGTFGDAGVWSFDSMKILSMADGGALWLRDNDAHQRAWRLRNLGLDSLSGAAKAEQGNHGMWWEFTVPEPSPRFDSNDLLASIGRVQLRKLPLFLKRRAAIWDAYQRELDGVGDVVLPPEPIAGSTTSHYLFWIQTAHRDDLARHLYANGVYTTFRYFPLHWAFGLDQDLPNAEQAARRTLCLPLHQNLTDDHVFEIVTLIQRFYERRSTKA